MIRATASILFLLLFNPLLLERAAGEVVLTSDAVERQRERSTPTSKESGDAMMRRIEGEMQQLRKSGQAVRDKRALGILLQGFLESLGYTVSPIQLASLPNTASAAPAPAAAGQSTPATPMKPAASPMPAPPRQRETLRFTGLLNFGTGQNASGLASHLTQYEQLFHGNKSASTTAGPDIDPRHAPKPPQDQPHLVKLPVPTAVPTAMPTTMPPDHVHSNPFSSEDSSEESYSAADELSDEEEQEERLCESEEADDSSGQPESQSQRLHEDDKNDESEQSGEGIRFSLAEQEARAEALAEEQLERELQRQQEQAEQADEDQDDEAPAARLPISCADDLTDKEALRDPVLRDSYGQRLPETAGVADYVRMFKDPRNSALEPQRASESFEQLDGSNRIPGPPGSRYEEYEIDAADRHTERKEHRAKGPTCRCAEAAEQRTPLPSSDRGIIQRLTSHDRQPAPERIGAWPATFDYLHEDSEPEGVVYMASSPAPFRPGMPPCEDKLKMIFRRRSADSYRSEQPSAKPRGFRESGSAKPCQKIDGRDDFRHRFPTSGTAALERKTRPPNEEGRSDHRTTNDKSASRPSDVTTTRSNKGPSTKSPRENRKSPKAGEQAPGALSMTEHRRSSARPTIKVKYTRPLASSRGDVLEETANYVERDGRLVVPEPTPYYFNEGFQGFTDEPAQTNTERVQIKRIRNHVASVKVSELKHPQPQSSMHIFKYARKL